MTNNKCNGVSQSKLQFGKTKECMLTNDKNHRRQPKMPVAVKKRMSHQKNRFFLKNSTIEMPRNKIAMLHRTNCAFSKSVGEVISRPSKITFLLLASFRVPLSIVAVEKLSDKASGRNIN